MLRYLRIGSIATGLLVLAVAAGFLFQMSWATNLWPWPAGPLSYTFLAAIFAAIATPVLWVGLSGEWGAIQGSGIFPFVMALGTTLFLVQLYFAGNTQSLLWVMTALAAVFSLALVVWGRRYSLRDTRAQPRLVRLSFAAFTLVLALAGGALVLKTPDVMPWPVNPEASAIFGWIFLGAATSYLYGFLRPAWNNARAPLLGFLVYDVILLPPLIGHFANVNAEHRTGLILYVAVLINSGVLAIYYLFIDTHTRSWTIQITAPET